MYGFIILVMHHTSHILAQVSQLYAVHVTQFPWFHQSLTPLHSSIARSSATGLTKYSSRYVDRKSVGQADTPYTYLPPPPPPIAGITATGGGRNIQSPINIDCLFRHTYKGNTHPRTSVRRHWGIHPSYPPKFLFQLAKLFFATHINCGRIPLGRPDAYQRGCPGARGHAWSCSLLAGPQAGGTGCGWTDHASWRWTGQQTASPGMLQ